jgi:hypothetical protein
MILALPQKSGPGVLKYRKNSPNSFSYLFVDRCCSLRQKLQRGKCASLNFDVILLGRSPGLTENMQIKFPGSRAALVVAHPGHELRVYEWFRLARPLSFVLTDGSGRTGKSRLPATTTLLQVNQARSGSIYGRMTDEAVYAALIEGEIDLFINIAEELAQALVRDEIDYVVGDAAEGYNPGHDICRYIINAAVNKTAEHEGRRIFNFDVLLNESSDHDLAKTNGDIWLELDEVSAARKLAAVRSYIEVADEVDRILSRDGLEAIRTERLRQTSPLSSISSATPYYESHGQRRVDEGHYHQVVRYQEHVRPIADALVRWAPAPARIGSESYAPLH